MVLTVKIAKAKGAKKGSKGAFTIRATSTVDSLSQDTVTALVKVALSRFVCAASRGSNRRDRRRIGVSGSCRRLGSAGGRAR